MVEINWIIFETQLSEVIKLMLVLILRSDLSIHFCYMILTAYLIYVWRNLSLDLGSYPLLVSVCIPT